MEAFKKCELSPAQEQILREQVIDVDRPGPLLRDFEALLEYVGAEGVRAAGKYNLLPILAIPELDQRLSRPLRLKLERPQLKSHPYLQGLHLLLRASGLSLVEESGPKARLVIDPVALECWRRLNPTEQYFSLLEAWLMLGRPGMIGDSFHCFAGFLMPCVSAWQHVPPPGYRFDIRQPNVAYLLGIGRDFLHVALMDLFGLMKVEHPRSAVQPWCPAGIGHLPFGDAVFTTLWAEWRGLPFGHSDETSDAEEGAETVRFGRWQPLFQPYFPDWRNNLVLPLPEPRAGVFVFRVSLGKIWRRIAIGSSSHLDNLVSLILRAVHFDCDHLYEFIYRGRFGSEVRVHHPAMDEGPWTNEVRIADLPLAPGQSMKLWYDFGDDWYFDVKLERIEPPGSRIRAPHILESHGKAPKQYENNW